MKRFLILFLLGFIVLAQTQSALALQTQERTQATELLRSTPGFQGRASQLDSSVTRAEFIRLLAFTLFPDDIIQSCTDRVTLPSDVAVHHWYAPFACIAYEQGVVSGYGDGTLQLMRNVNFAEAAKMLSIGFDLQTQALPASEPWYERFVRALQSRSVFPSSTSAPDQVVSRGEMAYMLSRLVSGDVTPSVSTQSSASVLGWIPYWDQQNAFQSFQNNVEAFDTISFFWYRLDLQGKIRTYGMAKEDASMINFAHQHGVKVLALVANLPDYTEGGTWDADRVDRVIRTASSRQAHIADLVALTEKWNFDGINIDYEALRASQQENFTRFIQDLASALHAKGKILGVTLHPKTSENNPAEDNGSHAQDWKAISDVADQLHLMTYAQHYSESAPGPIASAEWMNRVLHFALNEVDVNHEKIYLGLGLFGQEWIESPSGQFVGLDEELTVAEADDMRRHYTVSLEWDPLSQSSSFTFQKKGRQHIVWMEDQRSIGAKLELAERYGISHVAIWRLGGETGSIWQEIEEFVEN